MHALTLLAAMPLLASAQLMSLSDLSSVPSSQLQSVPIGAGSGSANTKRFLVTRTTADCAALPAGAGPVPSPDTASTFLAYSTFSQTALNARTPSGWTQVYQNLQDATTASGHLGYNSYSSYDTQKCASDCAALAGCISFNVFFERDPSIKPAANCSNPSSTTVIKCSFWSSTISSSTATNGGQYQEEFQVVIAGSNAYTMTQPSFPVSGYNSSYTGAATINAPTSCDSYITYIAHANQAYNPALCAADCAAERQNSAPFSGQMCRFFTSYQLVKNGVVQAQICALYTRTWDQSYATNTGYTYGSDVYTIADAYSYTYSSDVGTFTCPQGSGASSTTTSASAATSSTASSTVTSSHTTSSSTASQSAAPSASSCLTTCPQPLGYIVSGPERTLYAICLDTDYQIPSPQIYYSVEDNRACGIWCDQTTGCTKAVYNPSTKTCYLKGSPSVQQSNWRQNAGFQTLERIPDGTSITDCIALTYTITQNGKTWTVCPASNFFNNPAKNIWYHVMSEYDCAAKCQATADCKKFVYNWNTQTCYDKGNPALADTQWTVQSGLCSYYTS